MDEALRVSDEKQIQIAIVIQIDEETFTRSFYIADPGFRRNVHKRPAAAIPEQVTAPIATDDEQVQPPNVIEIRESRIRGALWKRCCQAVSSLARQSGLHSIEVDDESTRSRRVRRREQVIGPVSIDVANR